MAVTTALRHVPCTETALHRGRTSKSATDILPARGSCRAHIAISNAIAMAVLCGQQGRGCAGGNRAPGRARAAGSVILLMLGLALALGPSTAAAGLLDLGASASTSVSPARRSLLQQVKPAAAGPPAGCESWAARCDIPSSPRPAAATCTCGRVGSHRRAACPALTARQLAGSSFTQPARVIPGPNLSKT